MIEEGSFWDIDYSCKEYKGIYGEYTVESRAVEVDQIIMEKPSTYSLYKDNKLIANVGNSDLEVHRGTESVIHRRKPDGAKPNSTIVNLDEGVLCRVIKPTHGRIVTDSGDRRLICGNANDIFMTEADWEANKRREWY